MKMKPKLKINQIDNLHDARYCSAVGIGLLGFDLSTNGLRRVGPAKVKEMMDWLSGPESIGEFSEEFPAEISAAAESAELHYISLPMGYNYPIPAEWQEKLIFRSEVYDAADMVAVLDRAQEYPNAILDLSLTVAGPDGAEASLNFLKKEGLLSRTILTYDDPQPIYQWLEHAGDQVFGFSLGAFLQEPSGELDYQECDEFLAVFNELVQA